MSDIYVFGPKESENDYASMGLVGALEPEEVTFKETLNGDSLVTMKHPIDEFGAYLTLKEGNILVVPVPVRTTPEIQNGSCVTTVWTYKVKPLDQLTSQNQRTLYKAKTGSGRKKVLNAGEIVTVVQKLEDESARWKVKSEYGEGWINASADGPAGFELVTEHVIADNSQAIEEVQSPWSVMPQYFRIYEVKKSLDGFEVSARHISYDLLHNMTIYESENSTDLQTALKGVLENCLASHDFQAFTNVSNEQAGLFYKRRNPMDVLMNEEDGLCTRYDVCLVRDNYSLYLLHDPGLNRGVRIEYGKNMVGVEFDSSIDEVATRIVPVGEKKDGTDLYLSDDQNGRYIDSSKINNYPVPHVYELKCDNCKVGDKDENGGTVTVAVARARMKAQAEALLANGCDEPTITMNVEFVNLGDTLEYEQFKDLENCFLADYVIVQHPDLDIDITARIVEIEWDCLLNRMNSVTIGQVGKTLANTGITSWQIPSGISGAKIGSGTLGNAALKTDIIAAIHMQADSVNTGALQAESVTAEKLAAQAITADKIKAGSITANEIASHTITADKIAAETITGDNIAAGAITAVKIAGKTITADQLMAGLITADCGLIDTGAIQTAQIADGSITAAKIVSLNADVINAGTIKAERLLIAGKDGLIYQINATSSGLSKTELSKDQYKQQINGTVIVAQSITAAQIAAATITGNEIAANAIKAGNIDVASLFADEIFTGSLYTSKIYGDKSLEIIVGDVSKAQSDIDNMSIGGRNLVLKSENEKGPARNVDYIVAANQFTAGEYYTFSAEMKSPNENSVLVYLNDDSGGLNIGIGFERAGVKLTADWVRYSFVSKANKNFTYDGEGQGLGKLRMRIYGTTAGATDIMARKVKLEKGNKATDWTPALEDTDTKIDNVRTAADEAKTAADKAQTSVDDLEVGGRNYIRNGNFSDGEKHWKKWGSPTVKEVVEISGKHWAHIVGNADLEFQGIAQTLSFMRNEPLVLSFTAYSSVENTSLQMIIHQRGANNDPQIGNNWLLSTSPKKHYKAFTSADDATKTSFYLMLGPYKNANDVYITDVKFEKGNKVTDWTAAPEDTDGKIDNAQTAADNAQTAADAAQSTADSANKLALSANTGIQRMNEYVQIKEDGTHMRARDTDNEMVLSSQGVEINVGGQNYSQFGAMYVQFGNYQLRRTADGGLAFKLRVQGGE